MDEARKKGVRESTIACGYPINDVHTLVNTVWAKRNPEVAEFLANYSIEPKALAQIKIYQRTNGVEWKDAAVKFLKENKNVWTTWITESSGTGLYQNEIIFQVENALANE